MTFLKIRRHLRLTELNYIIDTMKTGNAATTNLNWPIPVLTYDQKVSKQKRLLRLNVTKTGIYVKKFVYEQIIRTHFSKAICLAISNISQHLSYIHINFLTN